MLIPAETASFNLTSGSSKAFVQREMRIDHSSYELMVVLDFAAACQIKQVDQPLALDCSTSPVGGPVNVKWSFFHAVSGAKFTSGEGQARVATVSNSKESRSLGRVSTQHLRGDKFLFTAEITNGGALAGVPAKVMFLTHPKDAGLAAWVLPIFNIVFALPFAVLFLVLEVRTLRTLIESRNSWFPGRIARQRQSASGTLTS